MSVDKTRDDETAMAVDNFSRIIPLQRFSDLCNRSTANTDIDSGLDIPAGAVDQVHVSDDYSCFISIRVAG